jgi:hypothetical protein
MSAEDLQTSLARGGNGWALNRMREDALDALLRDLELREGSGFDAEIYCDQVKDAFDRILATLETRKAKAYWASVILDEFQKFRSLYKEWNDIKGTEDDRIKERRTYTKKLRSRRRAIARKLRNGQRQRQIATSADMELAPNIFSPFLDLAASFPQLFANLFRAIHRLTTKLRKAGGPELRPRPSDVRELQPPPDGAKSKKTSSA